MKTDDKDYVRDGLGWIDDPRAPAGQMGQPFSRQLQVHAMLQDDLSFTLEKLCEHRYDKAEVRVVMNMILDQAYDEAR